jgi:hypothetical protein
VAQSGVPVEGADLKESPATAEHENNHAGLRRNNVRRAVFSRRAALQIANPVHRLHH